VAQELPLRHSLVPNLFPQQVFLSSATTPFLYQGSALPPPGCARGEPPSPSSRRSPRFPESGAPFFRGFLLMEGLTSLFFFKPFFWGDASFPAARVFFGPAGAPLACRSDFSLLFWKPYIFPKGWLPLYLEFFCSFFLNPDLSRKSPPVGRMFSTGFVAFPARSRSRWAPLFSRSFSLFPGAFFSRRIFFFFEARIGDSIFHPLAHAEGGPS